MRALEQRAGVRGGANGLSSHGYDRAAARGLQMVRVIFSLVLLIIGGTSRGFPLTQTQITIGQTVEGNLEEGDKRMHDGSYYDLYVFNGRRGQKIAIDLKSSDFDPYLTLLDSDGTEIVSDNDSGGDHNARIGTTLTYTGRYFIRVNSLKKDGKGKYVLQLK